MDLSIAGMDFNQTAYNFHQEVWVGAPVNGFMRTRQLGLRHIYIYIYTSKPVRASRNQNASRLDWLLRCTNTTG